MKRKHEYRANQRKGHTYVDQEGIHSLRVTLQPAVRVVNVAVLPEDVLITVDYPRVHTQDHLEPPVRATQDHGRYLNVQDSRPLGSIFLQWLFHLWVLLAGGCGKRQGEIDTLLSAISRSQYSRGQAWNVIFIFLTYTCL